MARGAARMAGEPRAAAVADRGHAQARRSGRGRGPPAAGARLGAQRHASARGARWCATSVDLEDVRRVKARRRRDRQRRLPRARRQVRCASSRSPAASEPLPAQGDGAGERARATARLDALGNRISFAFVPLPLDLASPRARLAQIRRSTAAFKRDGSPAGRAGRARCARQAARPVARARGACRRQPAAVQPDDLERAGTRRPALHARRGADRGPPGRPDRAGARALDRGSSPTCGRLHFGFYADPHAFPEVHGPARRFRSCTPRATPRSGGAEEEGPVDEAGPSPPLSRRPSP